MSITNGPNLGLMVNGLQGEAHYAQFMALLRGLDLMVMPVVKGVGTTTPPASPADGDAYIPGVGATGLWAGLANKLVRWSAVASAWESFTPKSGWCVRDSSSSGHPVYVFSSTTWMSALYLAGFLRSKSSGAGYVQLDGTNTSNPYLELYNGTQDCFWELAGAEMRLSNSAGRVAIRTNGAEVLGLETTGRATFANKVQAGGSIYSKSNISPGSGWELSAATMGFDGATSKGWLQSGGAAAPTNLQLNPVGGIVEIPNGINLGNTDLKNYQEGTWTPTAVNLSGSGITYSSRFTRVGNRVDFNLFIMGTGLGSVASSTTITLPFTPVGYGACDVTDTSVGNYGQGLVSVDGKVYLPTIGSTGNIAITGTLFI